MSIALSIAFCSVSIFSKNHGNAYHEQQDRLKESILKVYDKPDLFFYRDEYPAGAKPFLDSLYGFKPHAVQAARDAGHDYIVWCDTAIVIHEDLTWYDQFNKDGVLAIQDDNELIGVTSDACLKFFRWDRPDLAGKHLVGGSFYIFDFTKPLTQKIFDTWIKAEKAGIFGSQDEESAGKLSGHRADETVMALSLYSWGSKPFTHEKDTRYSSGAYDQIVSKQHFK